MAQYRRSKLWFNLSRVLSYNALISFIFGMRGGGKTYACKVECVDDFLDRGNQFVWTRRYDTELDDAKKDWGKAIKNNPYLNKKWGNIDYETRDNRLWISVNGSEYKLAGFFIPLSIASAKKSSEYDKVRTLVFDEVLIENGSFSRYLKNEVSALMGLIETTMRIRTGTRVILVSNAVSFANPYFLEWRVKPFSSEFLHLKNKSIVLQMYMSEEFKKIKDNSKFGKLISGSDYYNYAVMNKFYDNNDKFISKKPKTAQYYLGLKYENKYVSFWFDQQTNTIYSKFGYDEKSKYNYTLTYSDHDINFQMVSNLKKGMLLLVIQRFRTGQLRFDSINVKHFVINLLQMFS